MKKPKQPLPLNERIREARKAKGLVRREVYAMVPELREMDLYYLEKYGKHIRSHALVEAVLAALGMKGK